MKIIKAEISPPHQYNLPTVGNSIMPPGYKEIGRWWMLSSLLASLLVLRVIRVQYLFTATRVLFIAVVA
jgi:hypothetical protein